MRHSGCLLRLFRVIAPFLYFIIAEMILISIDDVATLHIVIGSVPSTSVLVLYLVSVEN